MPEASSSDGAKIVNRAVFPAAVVLTGVIATFVGEKPLPRFVSESEV